MCTVSWIVEEEGYTFLFGRDEKCSRPKASSPEARTVDGVSILTPIDPLGGGSWIAVNEFGLIVSVLNNYEETKAGSLQNPKTRGAIPIELSKSRTVTEAVEGLKNLTLEKFLPFHFCCIELGRKALVYSWNGVALSEKKLSRPMMTTSSFKSGEVQAYRENLFDRVPKGNIKALIEFHSDASNDDASFNPVMSREDAKTQSLSVIKVTENSVNFAYHERIDEEFRFVEVANSSLERSEV